MKNDVWEVVPKPNGKSIVTFRWIYRIKRVAYGSFEKHKSIFIAIGFSHKEGINYDETFSPVARYTPIRAMIALAFVLGWKLHQIDVKIAFLHDFLKKEVGATTRKLVCVN